MRISLIDFIEGKDKKLEIKKNITNLSIEISLQLFKVNDDLSGSLEVYFTYTEECSRCLKKYTNIINDKVEVFISSSEDQLDDESIDFYNLLLTKGEINIEDLIKEIFYINKPLKPLCSQNCKGL